MPAEEEDVSEERVLAAGTSRPNKRDVLGGDRAFNDRLSWVLVLPLSLLAWSAVYVLFTGLEVIAEGEQIGSARWWVFPLMVSAAASGAVRLGASVAPARKFAAALCLGVIYGCGVSYVAFSAHAEPAIWRVICATLAWAGAAAAAFAMRAVPDDADEPEVERKA